MEDRLFLLFFISMSIYIAGFAISCAINGVARAIRDGHKEQ